MMLHSNGKLTYLIYTKSYVVVKFEEYVKHSYFIAKKCKLTLL